MPIVSLGVFKSHGKTFLRGDEITSDVLDQIPAYVLKIQIDQGQVRNISEDDAQLMRWEQDEKSKEAIKTRKLKKVARLESKIAELKGKVESASTLRVCAEKAVEKMQAELTALMSDEPIEPEADPENIEPKEYLLPQGDLPVKPDPEAEAIEPKSKPKLKPKGKGKGKLWG